MSLTLTHETLRFTDDGRYPDQHLWLLRGPAGVIQFKAGRHRKDPGACDICRRYADISHFDQAGNCWQAWDLGYHSPRPTFVGMEPIGMTCDVLGGEIPCYYDGTSLGAAGLLDQYLAGDQSEDILREAMTERYRMWLVNEDEVAASPVTILVEAMRRSVDGGDES